MLIGAGKQKDGVYYYEKTPLKIQTNAVRTSELWHNRMGHPSYYYTTPKGILRYTLSIKELCHMYKILFLSPKIS